MKKFLLSLAGLALAFAANADRYFVHGTIFGNTNWESIELEKNATTGLYETTGTLVAGDFGVKITNDGGNDQTGWYSGAASDYEITEAGTYNLYNADNHNFASTIEGNYTISLKVSDEGTPETISFTKYEGVIEIVETYHIRGTIFDGSNWTDSPAMTEKDGVYSWTGEIKPGEFGIKRAENGAEKGWFSAPEATTITEPGEYPVTDNNGKNWVLQAEGTLTFTFDPANHTLTLSGETVVVETSYYLAGTFTGWVENSDAFQFEKDENGLYVYDMEDDLTPEAEFKITNGSWSVVFGSNGEPLEEGTAYICSDDKSADNITVAATITEPHFVFNPETLTLTITSRAGGEDDPVESDIHYYIRGDIFTGTWTDEEMTLTNGKYVLADKEVEAGNFGIKVANLAITEGDNQIAWYAALTEPEVKLNTPIELTDEDGKNLSISKGKYTFTLDLEAMTLTVTGEEIEDVDPVYAYSLYGPNTAGGSWDDNLMTEGTDGKWTITLDKPLVEFGIRYVDTAHNNKQEGWYSSADEDPAITDFGKYSVKEGGKNWTSTLTEPATYTFDPEAMTLTIDKGSSVGTIVAEEGEAVYFNLQGVRVANPENGMYIRVVNGKAQKVVK